MSYHRIQKLLLSEYTELCRESILVESPFAETTRDGRGLREVALGLTKTQFIIAADVFKGKQEYWCARDVDPCIETLELVSIYPLEFVSLSVFERKRRSAIKARLIDGRSRYYEIGGHTYRAASWTLWRERLNKLKRHGAASTSSSLSTRSTSKAATTTCYAASTATSKLPRSRGAGDGVRWRQKDLYMGEGHAELTNGSYIPVVQTLAGARRLDEVREIPRADRRVHQRHHRRRKRNYHDHRHRLLDYQPSEETSSSVTRCSSVVLEFDCPELYEAYAIETTTTTTTSSKTTQKSTRSITRKLSRFAFGVDEKCCTRLCATTAQPIGRDRGVVDDAVAVWESNAAGCREESPHLPASSIAPSTYFLHALGPWSVQPGERISVQNLHRSHSCAAIRRQPADAELRLPVSRRQLSASVSLQDLTGCPVSSGLTSTRGRVVLFWTPDYWYRPRAAAEAYREVRLHMRMLRRFRGDEDDRRSSTASSGRAFGRFFPRNCQNHANRVLPGGGTQRLRRLLKLDIDVSLWDVESATLAQQLTLIDRELFLRIPRRELETLARQRSSRDSPNLGAWIAFAHRVACLVASEVLREKQVDARARLIERLLKAAETCCRRMGNFHSARSILAGLQSPAVFRLRQTWTSLKAGRHHETMLKLSGVFESTRSSRYRNEWALAERSPPFMPYVGDVLARLLLAGGCEVGDKKERKAAERGFRRWIGRFRSPTRRKSQLDDPELYREAKINETADWLERCQSQARAYDFTGHSLAWEFLLKARYREDRDNFYASLRLEPDQVESLCFV